MAKTKGKSAVLELTVSSGRERRRVQRLLEDSEVFEDKAEAKKRRVALRKEGRLTRMTILGTDEGPRYFVKDCGAR